MSGVDLFPTEDPYEFPSDDDLEGMSEEEQIEALVEWFHWNFEDPAEMTPYETREGGYIYIWGGPYNASDALGEQFEEIVGYDVVQAATEIIQSDGLFDWAPASRRLREEVELEESVEAIETEDIEAAISTALDAVVESAKKVNAHRGGIGHNNPPEPIDDMAFDLADEARLFTSTRNIRTALEEEDLTEERIAEDRNVLSDISIKILKWLAGKADRAVDSFSSTLGKLVATGAFGVVGDLIFDLGSKIQVLLDLLAKFF